MARKKRSTPAELGGPTWPKTPIEAIDGEAVRLFVLALREAAGSASYRAIAERAGVATMAVHNLMTGKTWPDASTIAHLEAGLERRLWPSVLPGGQWSPAPQDIPAGDGPDEVGDEFDTGSAAVSDE